tara:strand:- start:5321 stop:6352 length:1032 start_codon:yes stop_codon:yes gene_type:complete
MEFLLQMVRYRLFDKQKLKRSLPINFSKKHFYIFKREIEREIPEIICTIQKKVNISYDEYFWTKFKILNESFFLKNYRNNLSRLVKLKFLIKSFFLKKRKIEKGLWLTNDWSIGYFHWFCDVLQQYYFFDKKIIEQYPLLLTTKYRNIEFINNSIELLNIKVIYINEDEVVRINNLITIPYKLIMGNYIPEVINKVSNSLRIENNITNKPVFVYITRVNAKKRKIINELEIINILSKYDFKIINCEDTAWNYQRNIFSKASILISNHGAGLTNMLFMSANTNIIELRANNSEKQNCYFSLSSDLKLNYYYLLGKKLQNSLDPHTADIFIETDKLNKLLKKIIK